MGKQFDIAETFGELLKNVPNSGTFREQIEYIELEKLRDDPNNFYTIDGLDELAANIELIGLQQPIRVRPDPEADGAYIIVSGHRRCAAIRKLVEDGREDLATVSCIVERDEASPELRELRLIYANAATREMSAFDKARQAERVTELLYKLKEQGVEFPGRMRDHVAEACQISKSKLSRLKVIQEKLYEPIKRGWEAGQISEASAYLLAQQDQKIQETIHRKYSSTAWHMTTDDLAKVIDRCKSDALSKTLDKLDKIVHKEPAPEKSMTEIGEDYVVQLQREDKRVYDVLRKCADRFICGLVNGQTTRRDSIERLRVGMRNSAWCGGGVDCEARNDGLIVDSLSRHPIKRSWTEVWDILALIALREWSVNRSEKKKNLAERHALQDERKSMEEAPVFKWNPVSGFKPQRVPLLTKTPTNAGDQYRVAEWDGVNWVDPNNSSKILTGLRPSEWLPVPRAGGVCRADTDTENPTPAAGGWISAETLPDHPCECVVEFDLGDDDVETILCFYDGEDWRWQMGSGRIDAKALRWCEVPCATGQQLAPVDASAWISVEDMLPAPGVEVITLDSDGDVDIDRIDVDTGKFFYGDTPGSRYHATHWAAIPALPERGEEDDA